MNSYFLLPPFLWKSPLPRRYSSWTVSLSKITANNSVLQHRSYCVRSPDMISERETFPQGEPRRHSFALITHSTTPSRKTNSIVTCNLPIGMFLRLRPLHSSMTPEVIDHRPVYFISRFLTNLSSELQFPNSPRNPLCTLCVRFQPLKFHSQRHWW